MIQSRCGIYCFECKYQESMGCKGCINIENPFWGKCKVKECCEEKLLNHCGECSEFPCELLMSFSYDKNEGDNGVRITHCKMWANK